MERSDCRHLMFTFLFVASCFVLFLPARGLFADWKIETLDGGYNTYSGRHCSMALDMADRIHIAYTKSDPGTGFYSLRYITNQLGSIDTWDSLAVDAPTGMSTGSFNAMVIDPSNHIHVSYYRVGGGDLMYADSSAWPGWTTGAVDTTGNVGHDTAIAVDASGGLHISYYDLGNEALKYAYKPAGGSWSVEMVYDFTCTNPSDQTCRVGQYTSIGIDSSGNPHIVYYENAFGYLKHAVKSSGSWSNETISTAWAEHETSLAMNGDYLHVSFYSVGGGDLMYATNAGGSWVVETVHNNNMEVGTYSSIDLDAGGNVHIAYHDETEQDLEYITNTSGFWVNQTVEADGAPGSETALAVAGNQVHIGYYKSSGNNLQYAHFDPSAPVVNATVPADQAQDVPSNHAILVAFSQAMDAATITDATVTLQDGQNNAVNGTVSYDATSHIAVFFPDAPLASDTTYTVTAFQDITDAGGRAMARDISFGFTTGTATDSTPPVVDISIPANNAVNVATNRAVMVLFSEEVDPQTITTASFLVHGEDVSGGGGYTDAVSGSVAYDAGNRVALFIPNTALSENRNYRVSVVSTLDDLGGTGMTADHTFYFTTGNTTDSTSVSTVSVTPAENATGVVKDSVVTIQFSEPINPLTLLDENFSVSESTPRTLQYNWYTYSATLTFDEDLVSSKRYIATAIAGIEDLAGNPLNPGKQWAFIASPGVRSTWPQAWATNIVTNLSGRAIEAAFYGDMDGASFDTDSFYLSRNGTRVPGSTVSYDAATRTAELNISQNLTLYAGATYTVTLTTAVQDQYGASLEEDYTWEFTTAGSSSGGGSSGCFISHLTPH